MWVTRSAQIHRTVPSSTSATWNRVGTFGSLAPPSTWRTSAIHQSSESLLPQMTVIPALTLRNTGAAVVETNLKRSSDIAQGSSAPVLATASGRGQAARGSLPGVCQQDVMGERAREPALVHLPKRLRQCSRHPHPLRDENHPR